MIPNDLKGLLVWYGRWAPLFSLEWIPRISHHSPGTGLQRWNHSLTIIVGTPALICSAMRGHTNTGNGVTALLLCSAQAFIPWFSARLIILKEASHYCNYPASKTWVTSFRTLCFTIQAHPCSFIFATEFLGCGGRDGTQDRKLTGKTSDIMNKAEHLNVTGIGSRHWGCQKSHAPDSDYLFTWHTEWLTRIILSLQRVKVKVWELPSSFASSINWATWGRETMGGIYFSSLSSINY